MSYLALIDEDGEPIDAVEQAWKSPCLCCNGRGEHIQMTGPTEGEQYMCDDCGGTGFHWPYLSTPCSHYWRPGAWDECQGDDCKRCGGLHRFRSVFHADVVMVILHNMGYATLMFEKLADRSIVLTNGDKEEITLPPLIGAGSDHLSAACAALLGTL